MKTKVVLYTPHDVQLQLHNSKARFRVGAWGRQSGKSTWANNELAAKALDNPETKYWFISPTYDQAKIQYRRLMGSLWEISHDILLKKNQTELRIKFVNGSEITFKSGDNYDNLRGETLHGVIIDEVRDQHPDLWSLVIRPMLATTQGFAAFISTPRGFDQFYDLAQQAQNDTTGLWSFFTAPSICNPLFSQQEFEIAKSQMSEAEFAQEILAEFRDLTHGKAYINYGNHNLVNVSPFAMKGLPHNPYLPIVLGCDFNLSPMAWTFAQINNDHIHVFDELWQTNTNTQECAELLIEKLLNYKQSGMMLTNPQVIITGDATSKAGQRAAAGQSDYDIIYKALNQSGFTWQSRVPDSNPSIKDRINTLNAKLKSAEGHVRLTLEPTKAPMLKRDLERVVWKAGTGAILDQTTDRTLTHSSDGVGYMACEFSPIQSINQVGTLRVIIR